MKKKRKITGKKRPQTTVGHGSRLLHDAARSAGVRDVASVLAKYRDPAMGIKTYEHPPRGARLVAELERLLTIHGVYDSPIRDKARSYLGMIRDKFRAPLRYDFYPRDHVPPGGKAYDEEFVKVEYFDQINTGTGPETVASGFANFDPRSGFFSIVGYGMGGSADVRAGPIVTLETGSHPADIWLTSNFLLDYQYQLSAISNPAFQGPSSAWTMISVTIDLLVEIDIRNLNGVQLSTPSAHKRIRHAEIQPGSNLPPYVVGTEEIVPGTQLQDSVVALPVAWDYIFSAPANCRIHIGVSAAPFVTATGYRGSPDYRHLGIADGRASGQITSVQAVAFT